MEKLTVITGTNASGKSGLAVRLAQRFGAEIVSADSRQVYRGLDLGSGKITPEEMQGVPHYLLDVAEPDEYFSLAQFQEQAYAAIDDITGRGARAFLVGGTGLYVNAVADGYVLGGGEVYPQLRRSLEEKSSEELINLIGQERPELLETIDLKNKRRLERAAEKILSGAPAEQPRQPRYETLVIGVTWPRDVLYERIRERPDRRLAGGMIEEVCS